MFGITKDSACRYAVIVSIGMHKCIVAHGRSSDRQHLLIWHLKYDFIPIWSFPSTIHFLMMVSIRTASILSVQYNCSTGSLDLCCMTYR